MKIPNYYTNIILLVVMITGSVQSTLSTINKNSESDWGEQVAKATSLHASMQPDFSELPLYFIANQGQMDSRVAYYVQGSDKTLYFTPQGVTFSLTASTSKDSSWRLPSHRSSNLHSGRYSSPLTLRAKRSNLECIMKDCFVAKNAPRNDSSIEGIKIEPVLINNERRGKEATIEHWNIKLDFVGANTVQPLGLEQTEAVISYFKGSQDQWHTDLPTYSKITYPNLWQGIDLTYNGTVDQLKYEFVLQPGADPDIIRLAYRGADVKLNEAGQLEVSTPRGGFTDDAPVAYQEANGQLIPIYVSYVLLGEGNYGFHLGAYDPSLPLVIDPAVWVYCGFIGGNDYDYPYDIAVDNYGNVYITGDTASADFPVTVGPDISHNGDHDAFVAKVNSAGTGLVYASYIGGDESDEGIDIAVDAEGNAYITGDTKSTETTFPVITGPDLVYNDKTDAFVAKINPAGTSLVYAGYIGGAESDRGYAIAVDSLHHAYISGNTWSTEVSFPVAEGPDLTFNGDKVGYVGDAFVAKIMSDGTGLEYAGYIGGENSDSGGGIVVDAAGYAYVAGSTNSTETTFPETVGPDLSHNGGYDTFITRVKADGTGFVYAGYIGGVDGDYGKSVAIDANGNAYVVGDTESTELSFPVIGGPDLTYNDGSRDAFVAKVRADGTGLTYVGYIGGNDDDYGNDIAVDAAGSAYISGQTESTEATFPVLDGPDLSQNGDNDAFVVKVHPSGARLVYAGYIGGDDFDTGLGIAVDTAGNAYVTGMTESKESTFPEIIGPDLTHNGDLDAYVAKISAVEVVEFKVYLPYMIR